MDGAPLTIPQHAQHYSVVLLKTPGRGPFLVQERAKSEGVVYPGKLGLFGGRREGSETAEACAIREVKEEAGIDLTHGELHLFGRLLSHDEHGHLSYGHIFYADDLDNARIKVALAQRNQEGRTLLLRRTDIGRNWDRLTSITGYAFSAYFDLERSGVIEFEPSVAASLAAMFGIGRKVRMGG